LALRLITTSAEFSSVKAPGQIGFGVFGQFLGAPGDVLVRPHQHAAASSDFARTRPVAMMVDDIARRGPMTWATDARCPSAFATFGCRSPRLAADAGQDRELPRPQDRAWSAFAGA
jgi:hypothetical protein